MSEGKQFKNEQLRGAKFHACGLALFLPPQIDDILAVDFVCAQHAGLKFAGEALRRLLDRRHRIERDVERGRSLGIEAAPVHRGPVA